jgi:hypothetical protein
MSERPPAPDNRDGEASRRVDGKSRTRVLEGVCEPRRPRKATQQGKQNARAAGIDQMIPAKRSTFVLGSRRQQHTR